jgi:myo-inositol 2-dehydrogenase/D-chiro-inositol 1-dehydrogenase
MKKVSRRDVMTGGLTIVTPAIAFGYQANSAISFGIIGTGGRGRYVGGLMAQDPRARLAMICDIYPDRIDLAKTQIPAARDAPATKDLHQLLADKSIDAVLIATPVYLHPEHFEAAAQSGKHIYCEKPAGVDVAGCLRLLKAAQAMDQSKTVAFGFQQRFSPEYLAAYNMVHDGTLGDLNLMISYWIWGGSAFRKIDLPPMDPEEAKVRRWTMNKETSGDFIVEQDCHGLDVLNWFAKSHPLKAIGDGGRKARSAGDNNDHYNVSYEYEGGLRGWLLGTQLPPRPYWDVKEQFIGTNGVLETARTYYSWSPADAKEVKRVDSKREITIDAVEAFFASIVDRKPYSMAKDAVDATLTSILGRMAAENRREVTWQEMLREGSRG